MIDRVLRARASNAGRFAEVLRGLDASWASMSFELAGGVVALWGAGLYVNRAFAAGHRRPITTDEFALLERRSSAIGVDAALEVSPLTDVSTRSDAATRGYVMSFRVSVLQRILDDADELPADPSLKVEPAARQLRAWQQTSAAGWGHVTDPARRASDAFAAAAAAMDGEGFVLARDAAAGHTVGCATVAFTDGVATLSAMATVPSERRRGVQAELVRHRLQLARAAGCESAITTAVPGGPSERNLRRLGFAPWFTIDTLVRPGPRSVASTRCC